MRTHLGRDSAWVQYHGSGWSRVMSGTNRPHLVTIEVSQVIGIQSHPSLLIDVRSREGDAE